MRTLLSATAALVCLNAPAALAQEASETPDAAAPNLAEEVAAIMVGSFSSADQSVGSETYGYVENETVRIWADREDGVWLYQENAFLGSDPETADPDIKNRPYFQTITRLVQATPSMVLTEAYAVSDREAARGAWRDPESFDAEWLGDKSCSGKLDRVAQGYWMGEIDCINTFRGAAYLRSRTVRTPDTYANWDSGRTVEDEPLWGPSEAGYIFTRK